MTAAANVPAPIAPGPYVSAFAVTKSDTTVFAATRGLYIGGTGNVAVTMNDGTTATFDAVPVGFVPLSVTQVLLTGTSASNIVGLR